MIEQDTCPKCDSPLYKDYEYDRCTFAFCDWKRRVSKEETKNRIRGAGRMDIVDIVLKEREEAMREGFRKAVISVKENIEETRRINKVLFDPEMDEAILWHCNGNKLKAYGWSGTIEEGAEIIRKYNRRDNKCKK